MKLFNLTDRKILKQQLGNSTVARITLSYYKYYGLNNPYFFRNYLYLHYENIGVLGRIYVAREGLNAQISVPKENWQQFLAFHNELTFLQNNRLNIAREDNGKSFYKLKIKVRPKIVADGLTDESFDVTKSGQHINAEAFNKLAENDDTIIVDMRNHYESEVGHFKKAITPNVDTFRDSLPIILETLQEEKGKNILMYCTGGIRCEKASAWFKHKGFEKVYQLNGGIIEYTKQVKEQNLENKFRGKNFVFDERLGERITDEVIAACHLCGAPCDAHTNCLNEACHLLFIQCTNCAAKLNGCCSEKCKEIYKLPIEEQRLIRKGKAKVRNVFKKGRSPVLKHKNNNL